MKVNKGETKEKQRQSAGLWKSKIVKYPIYLKITTAKRKQNRGKMKVKRRGNEGEEKAKSRQI